MEIWKGRTILVFGNSYNMPTLLEIYKYNILQGAGSMAFSKNITQYGPRSSFPYTHPSPTSASTGRTLKIIIKKKQSSIINFPSINRGKRSHPLSILIFFYLRTQVININYSVLTLNVWQNKIIKFLISNNILVSLHCTYNKYILSYFNFWTNKILWC